MLATVGSCAREDIGAWVEGVFWGVLNHGQTLLACDTGNMPPVKVARGQFHVRSTREIQLLVADRFRHIALCL